MCAEVTNKRKKRSSLKTESGDEVTAPPVKPGMSRHADRFSNKHGTNSSSQSKSYPLRGNGGGEMVGNGQRIPLIAH